MKARGWIVMMASLVGCYAGVDEDSATETMGEPSGGTSGGPTSGDPDDSSSGSSSGDPPDPNDVEQMCRRGTADRANMSEGNWSGSVAACDPGDISAEGSSAISMVPQGWTTQPDTTYHVLVEGIADGPIEYDVPIVDCG